MVVHWFAAIVAGNGSLPGAAVTVSRNVSESEPAAFVAVTSMASFVSVLAVSMVSAPVLELMLAPEPVTLKVEP